MDSGLDFETSRDLPLVSMVMRSRLDNLITQAAVDAGVTLLENTAVKSLTQHDDRIELLTSERPVKAKFIIAADGVNSAIARYAGWKETRKLIPAIECELYLDNDQIRAHEGTTRFDFGIIPKGYAWVFPKQDHLSVGLGSEQRGNVGLKKAYADYLVHLGIANPVKSEMHGFVIPTLPRKDGFARNRILLTGDAAGFAEPVTAEGISFAVISGQLAAQALIDSRFHEHKSMQLYEQYVAQEILPELKAGRLLAKILYGPPIIRNWLFKKYGDRFTQGVANVFTGQDSFRNVICRHLVFANRFGFRCKSSVANTKG
jgi:flavin-dependent dehydrogenase